MRTSTSSGGLRIIFSSFRASESEIIRDERNNGSENGKLVSPDGAVFLREVN
jgi:hypothetical protein